MKVEIDANELFLLQNEVRNQKIINERLQEEIKELNKKYSRENFEREVKMAAQFLCSEVIRIVSEKLGFNSGKIDFSNFRYNMFQNNRARWFIYNEEKLDIAVHAEFTQGFKQLLVNLTEIPDSNDFEN
jgi:hypothetical protein